MSGGGFMQDVLPAAAAIGIGAATGGVGDIPLAAGEGLDAGMLGADAGFGSASLIGDTGLLADTGVGAGAAINGADLGVTAADAGGSDWASGMPGAMNSNTNPSLLSQLGSGASSAMKMYGLGSQAMGLAGMGQQGGGSHTSQVPTSMMNRGMSQQMTPSQILGSSSGVTPGAAPGAAGMMSGGMLPQGMAGSMPGGMSNALSNNPQMMMMMMQRMQQQGMLGGSSMGGMGGY